MTLLLCTLPSLAKYLNIDYLMPMSPETASAPDSAPVAVLHADSTTQLASSFEGSATCVRLDTQSDKSDSFLETAICIGASAPGGRPRYRAHAPRNL
jgi:hypothetical protein